MFLFRWEIDICEFDAIMRLPFASSSQRCFFIRRKICKRFGRLIRQFHLNIDTMNTKFDTSRWLILKPMLIGYFWLLSANDAEVGKVFDSHFLTFCMRSDYTKTFWILKADILKLFEWRSFWQMDKSWGWYYVASQTSRRESIVFLFARSPETHLLPEIHWKYLHSPEIERDFQQSRAIQSWTRWMDQEINETMFL